MREQNLDLIRGFLILYVVFYHMSLTYGICSYEGDMPIFYDVMSFFMVPFYFFSGYLFSSKRALNDYIKNKSRKLILPYVLFAGLSLVIYYIYSYLANGNFDLFLPFNQFITTAGLGANTPLWFLFSLYFVSVIYYFIDEYCVKYKMFVILLCFIFAYIVHNRLQILSWGNISLGLVYYHCGYELKKYNSDSDYSKTLVFVVSFIVFILICLFDRQNLAFVNLFQRRGLFILNLPFSLAACYILFYISNKIKYLPFLNYIGRYSLVLFASHRVILNWIYNPVIMRLQPNVSFALYVIIGAIIILGGYILILLPLKKYCPKLIGL